jgi:hypothetical protein
MTDPDKLQIRLDAALDALAECRKRRDWWKGNALAWRDLCYQAMRGDIPHDLPMEAPDVDA